jgi:penicillin G amidase
MAQFPFARAAGIAISLLAGATGVATWAAIRRPMPKTNGTLRIPALQAAVQVLRDHWGVPHVYAENEHDLFIAQGYVHAQDRLWQMEFQRHLGHGRLSELVGAVALDTDRYLRILGFSRIAQREAEILDTEVRTILEYYALGINSYIEQHRNRMPIEFTLLRHSPAPWQIADSLVWSKVMALNLSGNWTQELLRAQMVATLGAERASQLDPTYPSNHPLIIPEGVRYKADIGADALRLLNGAAQYVRNGAGQGSNNWVVSGTRSETGMPLLANDPHLTIAMPSVWYEMHLSAGSFQAAGASFVGTPAIVIGHNQQIAWGVTNGMNDTQDLYIERFDPDDPTRYLYQNEWHSAEIVREEIRIKGQSKPHIETVRITRHGPVISPLIPTSPQTDLYGRSASSSHDHQPPASSQPSSNEALALRWTALEPSGRIIKSILAINRASDWYTFRNALSDWHVPPQNFVYADTQGHIGYTLGGDIPVRAKGDGRLPVPGWTGEYEWVGIVPHGEMPHSYDPKEQYAVSANNRIVGAKFTHSIPGEYLNGYRAARIRQLIEQTAKHTFESFQRIHADRRSLPGLEIAALAGRFPTNTPISRTARDLLASWDGELSPKSAAARIYTNFRDRLVDAAYAEAASVLAAKVGIGAFASLPGEELYTRATPAVIRRATERDDSWLPAAQTWDALLAHVWEATIAELRATYGDNIAEWRYGRDHTLTIRHTLGAVPAISKLLNRGPFETGGDIDTICMGNLPRSFAGQPYYVAPSYRQILDTSNWNRSRSIHPTGQSGHPASPHYADFVQPWLNGEYHPMPWDRTHVEEATAQHLTLTP